MTEEVRDECKEWLLDSVTPIFEFTAPDNRIVIQYPESALTLLALRRTISGEYLDQIFVDDAADMMEIKSVPIHTLPTDPKLFLHHARSVVGLEGFVIRFCDGFIVKAKGDDYVLKHRAKDSVLQEKNVLALIARDELDDVLPLLDAIDRTNVERYRNEVLAGINEAEDIIERIVSSTNHVDQKTFATVVLGQVIPQVRSLAFQVRAGAKARDAILSSIIKNSGSAAGVDHVRALFGAVFHANNNNNQADAA